MRKVIWSMVLAAGCATAPPSTPPPQVPPLTPPSQGCGHEVISREPPSRSEFEHPPTPGAVKVCNWGTTSVVVLVDGREEAEVAPYESCAIPSNPGLHWVVVLGARDRRLLRAWRQDVR